MSEPVFVSCDKCDGTGVAASSPAGGAREQLKHAVDEFVVRVFEQSGISETLDPADEAETEDFVISELIRFIEKLHADAALPRSALGQAWVSRVTQSDSPDVSVVGADVGPMPSRQQELIAEWRERAEGMAALADGAKTAKGSGQCQEIAEHIFTCADELEALTARPIERLKAIARALGYPDEAADDTSDVLSGAVAGLVEAYRQATHGSEARSSPVEAQGCTSFYHAWQGPAYTGAQWLPSDEQLCVCGKLTWRQREQPTQTGYKTLQPALSSPGATAPSEDQAVDQVLAKLQRSGSEARSSPVEAQGWPSDCPHCHSRSPLVTWPSHPGLFGCRWCGYRWRPPDTSPAPEAGAHFHPPISFPGATEPSKE